MADVTRLSQKITVRIPANWTPAIEAIMRRKGITNLSDFTRQAVMAEIGSEHADEPMAVNFATGKTPEPPAPAGR